MVAVPLRTDDAVAMLSLPFADAIRGLSSDFTDRVYPRHQARPFASANHLYRLWARRLGKELFDGHVLLRVFGHNLGAGQLKVLLRDVNPSLAESIHASLGADTLECQRQHDETIGGRHGQHDTPREQSQNTTPSTTPRHGTLSSAPEAPGICSAILRKFIPRVRFILRE